MTTKVETVEAPKPKTRKWSRDEYYQMADLGWFQDQRVELIDGEIIEMPAQRNTHVVAVDMVQEALKAAFGKGSWVRMQAPLLLRSHSAPEPDAAVVQGSRSDFNDNPTTALLVVEVSDTALTYDAGLKANLYSAAGIAEYWIVNLVSRRLEVRRNPLSDETAPFGHRYADLSLHQRGDSVTPLARPQSRVAVADLLPGPIRPPFSSK